MNSQNELYKKVHDKVLIDPHYNVSESLYNEMWALVGEKLSSWVWEQLWYETRGILYTTKTNAENLTNERLRAYEL